MIAIHIILTLGLYIILELLAYFMGWNDINKTTAYDSPKDELFYTIGEGLKVSNSVGLEQPAAAPGAMVLVDHIEETNTFIFERCKAE